MENTDLQSVAESVCCPICMDGITPNKNCTITECGHSFHTSCLMQNIAHNGFGCPYCRAFMVEEHNTITEDNYIEEISMQNQDQNTDIRPFVAEPSPVNLELIVEKFREKYEYNNLVEIICAEYDFTICNNNVATIEDAFKYIDDIYDAAYEEINDEIVNRLPH